MKDSDKIFIRGLRVSCHIGVPAQERAQPQELQINATFSPFSKFASLEDDIQRSIDYNAVAVRIEQVACERSRKLIETLAEDLAAVVLDEFQVSVVTIDVRKFILPNTRYVGVSITRSSDDNGNGKKSSNDVRRN